MTWSETSRSSAWIRQRGWGNSSRITKKGLTLDTVAPWCSFVLRAKRLACLAPFHPTELPGSPASRGRASYHDRTLNRMNTSDEWYDRLQGHSDLGVHKLQH